MRCVSAVLRKVCGGGHLTTRKHGIARGDIVVEEAEKKQCWKMFSVEMLLVLDTLLIDNPEGVRELSRKYGEEHKEEKKAYNQEYNRREVECESCGCKVRKCNWLRHLGTKRHLGVQNGGGGGDMGGKGEGAEGRS